MGRRQTRFQRSIRASPDEPPPFDYGWEEKELHKRLPGAYVYHKPLVLPGLGEWKGDRGGARSVLRPINLSESFSDWFTASPPRGKDELMMADRGAQARERRRHFEAAFWRPPPYLSGSYADLGGRFSGASKFNRSTSLPDRSAARAYTKPTTMAVYRPPDLGRRRIEPRHLKRLNEALRAQSGNFDPSTLPQYQADRGGIRGAYYDLRRRARGL